MKIHRKVLKTGDLTSVNVKRVELAFKEDNL